MKIAYALVIGFTVGFAMAAWLCHHNHPQITQQPQAPCPSVTVKDNDLEPRDSPPTIRAHHVHREPSCPHNDVCIGENNGTITQTNR